MAGTATTSCASAVVTPISAVIPASVPSGTSVMATATSYETTPPVVDDEDDRVIRETTPSAV